MAPKSLIAVTSSTHVSLVNIVKVTCSNSCFNHKKATQALNFFATQEGGEINKMKAIKLIYLADRYHLRKYGRLITNDTYFAMNYGPVPSGTKDIAEKSQFLGRQEKHYSPLYLSPKGRYKIESVSPVDQNIFSDSDLEALEYVWLKFGSIDQFQLARLTHLYPEWAKHKQDLQLDPRIQMAVEDFLDDPTKDIDKCFELSAEDRQARREQLEEAAGIESLWS